MPRTPSLSQIILNIAPNLREKEREPLIDHAIRLGFTKFFGSEDLIRKFPSNARYVLFTSQSVDQVKSREGIEIIQQLQQDSLPLKEGRKEDPSKYAVSLYITNKKQEETAIAWARTGINCIICQFPDWTVVPLENLISRFQSLNCALYVDIGNKLADIELIFRILDRGADGIVFSAESKEDLTKLHQLLLPLWKIPFETALIEKLTIIPDASRVCVDTNSLLEPGEGLLVGTTSSGFIFIHAELMENVYISPRPFRVNAGDVSEYLVVDLQFTSPNVKPITKYLSELRAGDKVVIAKKDGSFRYVYVSRVKIESRPMILITLLLSSPDMKEKIPILAAVQYAETVNVISRTGKCIASTQLKIGDILTVFRGSGATHMGFPISERLHEW